MIDVVVILAYVSLGIELVFFPVPSNASSWSLMKRGDNGATDRLAYLRALPSLVKLLVFALPTAVCVVIFLLPLWMAFRPELRNVLGPIELGGGSARTLASVTLLVIGRALTFSSVLSMRGSGARLFRPARPEHVRRSQLFARSRNPGLLGMFIFYAGLVGSYPCWALLIGVPIYYGHMHLRVLVEESNLESVFGDTYRDYFAVTRRYL